MILTYKVKHGSDFCGELAQARKVAEFAIANRDKLSSKYVSHIGLKSVIANQILRKYGRNKKAKSVKSVNLIIPNQGIKYKDDNVIIPSLKLGLQLYKPLSKINQIEVDNEYAYISGEISERQQYKPETHIGVDLNTTGHCAVIAIKETGKVYKLGKPAQHYHTKYKNIRKMLQKKRQYKAVKRIKHRESSIVKNINHQISRAIIDLAVSLKGEIHLEKLEGIRNIRKGRKSFKYALHSWSFFQLGKFIDYKALLAGVSVVYDNPAYTSQVCSKCGVIGERNGKIFKCPNGHVEHADVNAAFNLALPSLSIVRLQAERDVCKRSTDTHQKATFK